MARPESVDAYFESLGEVQRARLGEVRALLRAALPDATEVISYSIPAFRTARRVVIFYAAWKTHWSMYPVPATDDPDLEAQIAARTVSRGTLRFELDEPVPVELITAIARLALAAGQAPKR